MSNTKIDLIKKSHATKPEKLNINVEEEFSNLYISNNKFKRGVRRISHKIHDLFSKENKWGKRPTAQEVTDINERVDKIKKDFEELQTLYNKKIEEIERLENNQDYKNLIEKSKNPDSDENNKTLQEISSKFIYAKDCITNVLNYIKGLPQSVEEMLSWRKYHQQRGTWHGRFAKVTHMEIDWANKELSDIERNQTTAVACEAAIYTSTSRQNGDDMVTTFKKQSKRNIYEFSGLGAGNRAIISEGAADARKINTATYDKYFKPVVDLKGTFETLEKNKKTKQDTYKKLKGKAERNYHLLPGKSLENMTRLLYQVSDTVDALIKKIRDNYGNRLDKGFFVSTKNKEEKLKSIDENIKNCESLLETEFANKVKEFTDRITTLKTKVYNEKRLSESANQEITGLAEFCETVKQNLEKFKTVNTQLVKHIKNASEKIYYAYTKICPIRKLILRDDQFPVPPEIDLNKL